jgi:hypothetical protein
MLGGFGFLSGAVEVSVLLGCEILSLGVWCSWGLCSTGMWDPVTGCLVHEMLRLNDGLIFSCQNVHEECGCYDPWRWCHFMVTSQRNGEVDQRPRLECQCAIKYEWHTIWKPCIRYFNCYKNYFFILVRKRAIKVLLNQYSGKFKQNLIFKNTISLEITDKARSKLIFMTYTPDCIAGSQVCDSPVNSIWPFTDLTAVAEWSLAQCQRI